MTSGIRQTKLIRRLGQAILGEWRTVRVGLLTRVRLLTDAISAFFHDRSPHIEVFNAVTLGELETLAADPPGLGLVLVDTIQAVDLDAIRDFHFACPEVPLLALGLREQEAEIIAHGTAGFSCYLKREDGMDSLCAVVEDALEGRLHCKPEIAGAMMRALFRRSPPVSSKALMPLTRREAQVARLVSHAMSNKEIARELQLSESTVKHHVHSILHKFGVSTRGQLSRTMRDDAWGEGVAARRSGYG